MAGAGATAERTAGQRPRDVDEPSHTITGKGTAAWVRDRPATTVAGDPRVHPPGHKVNADDVARLGADEADARYDGRAGKRSVRVTLEQAARLQSFPDGYPWRGTKTSRHAQVGNAVPPLLAAHVLRPLLGG